MTFMTRNVGVQGAFTKGSFLYFMEIFYLKFGFKEEPSHWNFSTERRKWVMIFVFIPFQEMGVSFFYGGVPKCLTLNDLQ